jgi:hypothetical protein
MARGRKTRGRKIEYGKYKGHTVEAVVAALGIFMILVLSATNLGLSAAAVAHDHSRIAIAHLVVVCLP